MRPPHADTGQRGIGISVLAALAACTLAVAARGSAGTGTVDPSFAPGPPLPVGSSPHSVAVDDFDGNGAADLAVGNAGYRSNLRILLNDGAGRLHLAPGSPFKAGTYPGSVLAADFNGDGKPDLAVAGDEVRILLGTGAARFTAAAGPSLQLEPLSIDAADLTSDGRPDLVALTWSEKSGYGLSILLNDGSGSLSALPGPAVNGKSDSASVALADFNRDGKQDLAVSSDTVSIFPGDGTGGFGPALEVTAGARPGELGTGDFNLDGTADLAAFTKAGLAILLGDGTGGFRPAPGSPIKNAAYGERLAIADLSGDGKPDLAFVDPSDTRAVAVLVGDGTGRFRPARFSSFYAGWPREIAAADFNRDGRADLFPLSGGTTWGPAPRGGMILFQTASAPRVRPARTFPARADAVLSTRERVSNLAADGRLAAICTDRLILWTAPVRRSRSVKGDCYDELAVAGGRVAWIDYSFGNTERAFDVFAASAAGGKPRAVASGYWTDEANPDDAYGPWWGQLLGGGSVLAYNAWWVDCVIPPCDEECQEYGGPGGCESGNPTLRVRGQQLLRLASRRPVGVRRGPGAYPLRAVGGGRIAVEPKAGIVVVTPSGRRVSSVPAQKGDPPRGVALSANHLALLRTFTLDLYNPATGARQRSIALGPAAGLELAGVSAKLALLRGAGHLVLVRLSDGKLVSFAVSAAAAAGFVDAKLTGAGLFYAYNLPRGKAKGRVVFERTAKLLARFQG